MKKRLIAVLTSLCMILAMTPMAYAEGGTENPHGQMGENVYWELLPDGTFNITGTGPTYDYVSGYSDPESPIMKPRDYEPYCEDVKAIHIGEGITGIGSGAFHRTGSCWFTNATELSIADTVEYIGDYAFTYVPFTHISIPDSVTSLGRNAFENCSDASILEIGAGLESIGEDAFYWMSGLQAIKVSSESEAFFSHNGILYNKDRTKLIMCPMNPTGLHSYSVLPTVVEIGEDAFSCNNTLHKIYLNEGLKIIGEGAFSVCTYLGEVNLPESLEVIGKNAFFAAGEMSTYIIPANVKKIGYGAFDGYKQVTITFMGDAPEFVPAMAGDKEIYLLTRSSSYAPTVYVDCSKKGWKDGFFEIFDQEVTDIRTHHIKADSLKPACTEAGYETNYVCSGCGKHFLDKDGQEPIDDFDAWKEADGNRIEPLGHSYTDWEIEKYPTCTTLGAKGRICRACGETEIRDIAALGHSEVIDEAVPATCTESGLTEGKHCDRCEKVLIAQKSIPAKGHVKDEATVKVTPATLTADGSVAYDCLECKAAVTEKISRPAAFSLSASTFTYDGKAKKPAVTVKDGNGNVIDAKYYDLSYGGNIQVGKPKATVTFKDRYAGTKTLSFTIKPKKASIASVKAGKKKMTVKAGTKVAATGGTKYQISYRAKGSSAWKSAYTSNQSKIIKSLKKGKKYQVKIRAYKLVDGKKSYGAWSKIRTTVKIK